MDNKWEKDDLSFIDSWKNKDVELAAATALVVGAGFIGAKGSAPNLTRYGKQALGQAEKGFEKYVKRSANPVIKQVYMLGKGVYKNRDKMKLPTPQENYDEMMSRSTMRLQQVNDKKLKDASHERYTKELGAWEFEKAKAKELGLPEPTKKKPDPILVEETVRQELSENADVVKKNTDRLFPQLAPKEVANNIAGAGIAGLGFGAGITGYHMLNDKLHKSDKKRDRTFEAAGSTHKKDWKRDDRNMDKKASTRAIHDGIAGLAKKVPAAAATGVGFTGVSLGAAHVLNKNRKEEEGKNRIIIELGEDDPMSGSPAGLGSPGGLGLLPRTEFNKNASVNSFLKNIGGRGKEINPLRDKLKDFDYNAEAARTLKGGNVDSRAKNEYGHLFGDEKAKEKLFEAQAKSLQQTDKSQIERIKDEVADARVKGIGGLGLAGLGVAGTSSMMKEKKEVQPNA